MYSEHVASDSPEELAAFAAAIQLDAIASIGETIGGVVSKEMDRLEGPAGQYPDDLFQG